MGLDKPARTSRQLKNMGLEGGEAALRAVGGPLLDLFAERCHWPPCRNRPRGENRV